MPSWSTSDSTPTPTYYFLSKHGLPLGQVDVIHPNLNPVTKEMMPRNRRWFAVDHHRNYKQFPAHTNEMIEVAKEADLTDFITSDSFVPWVFPSGAGIRRLPAVKSLDEAKSSVEGWWERHLSCLSVESESETDH